MSDIILEKYIKEMEQEKMALQAEVEKLRKALEDIYTELDNINSHEWEEVVWNANATAQQALKGDMI